MLRLATLLVCLGVPALAAPEQCLRAARQAAAEVGLAPDLLIAIATVESGRRIEGRLSPWPWTANLEGRGHWFDSPAALVAFVEAAVAAGRTSVDIGCFQINWRWHGADFARPADLADPLTGARHAARFLLQLHRELGDWERAVGAYHSRDPVRAARYAAQVAAHRGRPEPPRPPAPVRLRTGWALPIGPAAAGPGSLMPASTAARPFLAGLAP